MPTIPEAKLEKVIARWEEIQASMAEGGDQDAYVRLAREFAELDRVVAAIRDFREIKKEHAGLQEIIADPDADTEMVEMAREELPGVGEKLEAMTQRIGMLLLPKDAADDKSVIVELRAGTGGDEAALFAGDLFRMYQRYADLKGWKVEIMSANEAAMGGYKEIIASVAGAGAFARLKYESGVHRVQRVPETESSGRIHTSAATVAVLPEAEDVDVVIEDKELRIDVFRASGPGGQSVNTTDSAVRITHLPTGLVVIQQDEKSQHKNRAKAMKVLRSRLYDMEREKLHSERAADRRGQIGSGDRSQRIRTYNFPQGRVTDHRIGLTLHKLNEVLGGEGLDEVIDVLTAEDQASQLAAIDEQSAA